MSNSQKKPISPEKFYLILFYEQHNKDKELSPTEIVSSTSVIRDDDEPIPDRKENVMDDDELSVLLDQCTLDIETLRPWPSFISFNERNVVARLNYCRFKVHDFHMIPLPAQVRTGSGFTQESERFIIDRNTEVMANLPFFLGFQIYQPTLLIMTTGEPSNYTAFAAKQQMDECERVLGEKYKELQINHTREECNAHPDIKFLLKQIVSLRTTTNVAIQNNLKLPMSPWYFVTSTCEAFHQYSRIRDIITTYLGFTQNLDIKKAKLMGQLILNSDDIFYEEQKSATEAILNDPEIHAAAISINREWFDKFGVLQKYPPTHACQEYVKSGKLLTKMTQYTRTILDTFEKWIYTMAGASHEVIDLLKCSKQPMPSAAEFSELVDTDLLVKQRNMFAIRHALHPYAWVTRHDSPVCKIVVGDGILQDDLTEEFQYNILHYIACMKSSVELNRQHMLYTTAGLCGFPKGVYNGYAKSNSSYNGPTTLLVGSEPISVFQ